MNLRNVDIALVVVAVLGTVIAFLANSAVACYVVLSIPFLFIVWRMVFSIWAAGTGRDPRIAAAGRRPTYCQRCEYDLLGLPASAEVCPECGQRIHPSQLRTLERFRQS